MTTVTMPPHVEAGVVNGGAIFHTPCSLDLAGRGLSKRERGYVANAMEFSGPVKSSDGRQPPTAGASNGRRLPATGTSRIHGELSGMGETCVYPCGNQDCNYAHSRVFSALSRNPSDS